MHCSLNILQILYANFIFIVIILKVADFKAPGFNVSGKLQQGTYCPKAEVWLQEYDPLHTILRTVHRREFQQSMDRYTEL